MEELKIDTNLIEKIRDYLKAKTGIWYFKHIRFMGDNIQVTCPFHKQGQENKPSASIRVTEGEKSYPRIIFLFYLS